MALTRDALTPSQLGPEPKRAGRVFPGGETRPALLRGSMSPRL